MDQVPVKLGNNGTIPTVEEVEVRMNAFRMDLSKAKSLVYKFELKFIKTSQRAGPDGTLMRVDIDLSRGQANDFARQAKRRTLWECYQKLLADNANFFTGDPRQHCYDCGINFYSLLKLLNRPGDMQTFPIEWQALSPESHTYLGLRRTVAVRAELKVPGQFEQQELELRDAHYNVDDHSLEQFIDVLTTTEMQIQDSHLHYPQSKYFLKDDEIQIRDEARVLKRGLAKNVRFVGNNPADSRLIVQIEPRKTAFFPAVSVIDFLSALLPGAGPTMDLAERLTLGNAFEVASQQLKGLVVVTIHRDDSFPVHGLTQLSAQELKFRQRDGSETTVAMYFSRHYKGKTTLTYPRLPCAVQRKAMQDGGVQESYHPLELLRIAPGQRVPIEKQTPGLVEKMLKECQIAPEAYMDRAIESREGAFITPMANNRSFQAFEVDINPNPAKVNAHLLYPPAVEFSSDGTDREEVREGLLKWGKVGDGHRRFLVPAQPRTWAAILFGGCLSPNEAGAFLEFFVREANRRGIAIGQARYQDSINSTGINELRQGFKETYKANDVRFVLFFTKDKHDPVHHTIKELEVEHSIVTQHVLANTVTRALDKSRGGQMIIDNIMLKFNSKLGGVNYGLATSGEFRQRIGGVSGGPDLVKEGWLNSGRMFFGIDLSHASAQSRFQRQKEEPVSEPTVAGCAYTLGHPLLMRGAYWYQEPRLTHVARPPLAGRIEAALGHYHAKAKHFPHHLFVYRAGVSEGEFAAVLEHEKNSFIDAFDSLASKHGSAFTRPRLTIIIVQERSSYRIVPTAQVADKWRQQEERAASSAKKPSPSGSPVKAFNANVRPGTCVDRRIMHPTLTEFLLVGHRAIKGTARPIRCSVVWDDPGAVGGGRVSLEELENVTNALCYAHGIVCSPVSLPAPLYAASELAKRGRNNWKVRRSEDDERMERGDVDVAGIFHLQREQMDQPANFFGRMSSEMEARIPTKFWA